MKNNLIYILLSAVGLWLFYQLNKKPIKQVVKAIGTMTRGYRNNNPGNIRLTYKDGKKYYWKGEIDGTDTAFKTFKSMAWGYRAMFALLKEYIGKGYNTIESIINRYAPKSENATEKYIETVEKKTGLNRYVKIAASDLLSLTKLVSSISFVENGIPADEVQINEGKKLLS